MEPCVFVHHAQLCLYLPSIYPCCYRLALCYIDSISYYTTTTPTTTPTTPTTTTTTPTTTTTTTSTTIYCY